MARSADDRTTFDDRTPLEERTTALLHRLAAGASVDPPLWDDLIARRDGVVVRLPVGDHVIERPAAPPARRYRPRVGLAAAAVIAVFVAGVLAAERGFESTSPATEPISIVTPSEASFDASAATAVWATGATDPMSATAAYLHTLGIPTDPAGSAAGTAGAAGSTAGGAAGDATGEVIGGARGTGGSPVGVATLTQRSGDGTTAVVDWTLDEASGATGGTVYLRSSTLPVAAGTAGVAGAQGGAPGDGATAGTGLDGGADGWAVVGSSAQDVSLDQVSYDGEHLAVDVSRTAGTGDQLAITMWINGRPVSIGGETVADDSGQVALGEAIDIGDAAGSAASLAVAIEPDDVVTMRVVHVLEGKVRSVAQMALALPDAAPEKAAEVAAGAAGATAGDKAAGTVPDTGSATADADANADAGAGADRGGADAGAEGGVSGSTGHELLPGVTVPTLPPPPMPDHSLPSIPEPEDGRLPVPTTKPSGADLMP
jgi:hypothetical protein